MKLFDPEHSSIEVAIRFEKFLQRAFGNLATTRESDMRMPRAQVRFQSDSQRCVLHSLVQLKKMRMTRAHAYPDDFRNALGRKLSDPLTERTKPRNSIAPNRVAQGKRDIFRHVGEKTESQMHLAACDPTHAANMRIEIDKNLLNILRQIIATKSRLLSLTAARNSGSAASIAARFSPVPGSCWFTIFIMRAIMIRK